MTTKILSLTDLFALQLSLQASMGWPMGHGVPALKENLFALLGEVFETLDETPWKSWKPENYKRIDREKLAGELVDCLKFWANACLAAGFTELEISQAFERKTAINHQRIRDGEVKGGPDEADKG